MDALGSSMTERLLTTKEFAERLSVSPKTVRRWVKEGKVLREAGRTPGGELRFQAEDGAAGGLGLPGRGPQLCSGGRGAQQRTPERDACLV